MDITFDEFLRNEELAVDVTKVDWGEIKKGKRRGATMNEKDDGVDDENEPELESTDSGKNFHDSDYDFREDEDDIIYKNCATTADIEIDGQRSVNDASYGGEKPLVKRRKDQSNHKKQKQKEKEKEVLLLTMTAIFMMVTRFLSKRNLIPSTQKSLIVALVARMKIPQERSRNMQGSSQILI